jgi:hypothetical protein
MDTQTKSDARWNILAIVSIALFYALVAISLILYSATYARSRDNGQWAQLPLEPGEAAEDRANRGAWYQRQMMPDNINMRCCGEADAYYADRVHVDKAGYVWAVITDERDDAPLGRPHIKPGTLVYVPPYKNKDTRADPNPTGHTIVFVRWYDNIGGDGDFAVLCYLPSGEF